MSDLTWAIGSAVASALLVWGVSVSLGSLGVLWLVRDHPAPSFAMSLRRIRIAAAIAVLLAMALRAVWQSAALAEVPSAWPAMLRPVMFETDLGGALLLQGGASLAFLVATLLMTRLPRAAVALGLVAGAALAIAPGLGGHPAAHENPALALTLSFAHVAGVGLWLGTLAVLTMIAPRLTDAALADGVRRLHRVAAVGLLAVMVTGVTKVVETCPPLAALTTTAWGLALVTKLVAFTLVGLLGWHHWRRADADLANGGRGAMLRSFRLELGIAVVVLLATAVLINSAPQRCERTETSSAPAPRLPSIPPARHTSSGSNRPDRPWSPAAHSPLSPTGGA